MSALPNPAQAPLDRLGRPLHDLRLSVIEACNFRCGYCMPADRMPAGHGFDAAGRMDFDEIETLVRAFARLGLRKLRLTGIVSATREGRHSYYTVEDPHVVQLVEQIFEHIAPDGSLAPDPPRKDHP